MAGERPGAADPGVWVERLEHRCRREATEIRLRAASEAEEESARSLASANATLERRIARLRELRGELADTSARIERDLSRVAAEIRRRADAEGGDPGGAAPAEDVTYPRRL